MLLKKLSEIHGVSGNEYEVRSAIRKEIESFANDIKVDSVGNMIVYKKGRKEGPKIVLAASMDEIGIIITKITSDGLLKFARVGNFDPRLLVSKIVSIGESKLKGVIGAKPIHLQSSEERKTAIKLNNLYIDIGVTKREEAEALVKVGDYAAIESEFKSYGKDLLKGKALESRASCSILIELIKSDLEYSTYFVFSSMREVGISTGRVAVHDIKPDYTVIVDAIDAELGKGPVLNIKDLKTRFDKNLFDIIRSELKEKELNFQVSAFDYGGSNSQDMQLSNCGNKSIKIGFPCKYKKTSVNMISKKDYESTKNLLLKTISLLGGFENGI